MDQTPRKSSKTIRIVAVTLIIIVAALSIYAALTYPRAAVNFSISFTVGAQTERKAFDAPFLHSQVRVEVSITSGSSLWTARVLGNHDDEIWSHTAIQGGQTTYTSEWITLSTGNYNFTFATIGIGSLEADVTVTSKGGFW